MYGQMSLYDGMQCTKHTRKLTKKWLSWTHYFFGRMTFAGYKSTERHSFIQSDIIAFKHRNRKQYNFHLKHLFLLVKYRVTIVNFNYRNFSLKKDSVFFGLVYKFIHLSMLPLCSVHISYYSRYIHLCIWI